MTFDVISESQRKAARVAGISCLLAMVAVVIAHYGINTRLVVPGNAAETARNILAHERLFRVSVAFDLLYVCGVVTLLAALYVILEPVSRGLAFAAAIFRLAYAMMWVIASLNLFRALRLAGGTTYLQVFDADRLQAMARLDLAANFDTYYVGLPFFALASIICSYLWLKSRYVPRGLAVFGIISSAWCVICAFVFLIFPDFNKSVNDYWFDSPMGLFEAVLSFWLLFKGLPMDDDRTSLARASV